jgi:1,4-alpha-glucan branching enzyme
MPALEGVMRLYLVGDFNDWSIVSQPMTHATDGSWGITLPLDEKRTYQFRYFDNNGHWHNDWQADAYVPNQFGGENSVVSAEAGASATAVETPAAAEAEAKPKRRAPARKKAEGEAGAEAAAPKKRAAPRKKKTE